VLPKPDNLKSYRQHVYFVRCRRALHPVHDPLARSEGRTKIQFSSLNDNSMVPAGEPHIFRRQATPRGDADKLGESQSRHEVATWRLRQGAAGASNRGPYVTTAPVERFGPGRIAGFATLAAITADGGCDYSAAASTPCSSPRAFATPAP
jgi:hypothetical protein